jgi:hypothetical protein
MAKLYSNLKSVLRTDVVQERQRLETAQSSQHKLELAQDRAFARAVQASDRADKEPVLVGLDLRTRNEKQKTRQLEKKGQAD